MLNKAKAAAGKAAGAAADLAKAADDKLHINLGWYRLWNPSKEWSAPVIASLEPAFAELVRALEAQTVACEVPLALPHLSNYLSMAEFPHNAVW